MRAIGERIARDLDPRLADVWLEIYACNLDDEITAQLGWFIRMAYVQGFADASEGQSPRCLSRGSSTGRHKDKKGGGRR